MHCYACDKTVEPEALDPKTDRYYCFPCFEATNEVILNKEMNEVRRGESYGQEVLDYIVGVEPDFEVVDEFKEEEDSE